MFTGRLTAIAICPAAGLPMQQVDQIDAVAGRGLASDRYAEIQGAFSRGKVEPSQEVTLIESEALAAVSREYEIEITHLEVRRNLLTEGVPLNHLVGETFRVGDVVLRGVKLCEPCKYLEKLTGKAVETALKHRGGLRAQVVTGGMLKPGCEICPVEAAVT